MNRKKRGLALLLCICMLFTLMPMAAFADGASTGIVYGSYDSNGVWKQDASMESFSTITTNDTTDDTLTLSKTATPKGNNQYEIELKVVTTATSAAATVLVIDTSGSMAWCSECGESSCKHNADSRLGAAKKAAINFLKIYSGAEIKADGSLTFPATALNRYVSVVKFESSSSAVKFGSGHNNVYWVDVSIKSNYDDVVRAINSLCADGGTNLDAGLCTANTQLAKETVASFAAKNVVVLTDGMPTFYYGGDNRNGNHGSEGCPITNDAAATSATNLKNAGAKIYTVCYGVANDKCWSDWEYSERLRSYYKEIGETPKCCSDARHASDGPTVGEFLSGSIATPAANGVTYAYNAASSADVTAAFNSIANIITSGIKSGTVTDGLPTGVSLVGGEPTWLASGSTWTLEENDATVKTGNGKNGLNIGQKSYTYTCTYTVEIDPDVYTDDNYHPLNTNTYFTDADGNTYPFNVPGVKGVKPTYTVTYQYDSTAPAGAALPVPSTVSVQKDAEHTVATPATVPGWTFNGWTTRNVTGSETTYVGGDKFNMPNNNVTLTGSWTENPTYGVTYVWANSSNVPSSVTLPEDTAMYEEGATVTVADAPSATGWTFKGWTATNSDGNTVTITDNTLAMPAGGVTITGDWERNTHKVTYEYETPVPAGAPALPNNGNSYDVQYATEVSVATKPTLDGYTFSGWTTTSNGVTVGTDGKFTMPDNDVVFTGSWTERGDISYTIKYYWIGDTTTIIANDETGTGTFNATVTATNADLIAIPGYTALALDDQTDKSVKLTDANGNNVIKLYYYKNVKLVAGNGSCLDTELPKTVTPGFTVSNIDNTAISGLDSSKFAGVSASGTAAVGDTSAVVKLYYNSTELTNANVAAKKILADGKYIVTEVQNGTITVTPTYAVTYKYVDSNGDAITSLNGTTLTAPTEGRHQENDKFNVAGYTSVPGYAFSGWTYNSTAYETNAQFTMPGNAVEFVGTFTPQSGLSYTVNYYWNGDSTKPFHTETGTASYGDTITAPALSTDLAAQYTIVPDQITELEIASVESNVLDLYYYKNVVLEANSATYAYDGNLKTVETFKSYLATDATKTDLGLTFVDLHAYGEGTDVNTDPGYPVQFMIGGKELVPVTSLSGRTDSTMCYYVTEAFEGVLKITGTYKVSYMFAGDVPTSMVGKEPATSGWLSPSDPYTVLPIPSAVAGYTFVGWTTSGVTGTEETYVGGDTFNMPEGNVILVGSWEKIPYTPPVDPGIYTKIIVKITGNSASEVYDGTEKSVEGYTVEISDPRYTEKDFKFTGTAEAKGTFVGEYPMGLEADQFVNINRRFKNVEFIIVEDGVLTITARPITITAGSAEGWVTDCPITCDEWTSTPPAPGDTVVSVKITGVQNGPGSSPNVPSDAVIKNEAGKDVTGNYDITYVNGLLVAKDLLEKEDHFNYVIGYPDGSVQPNGNITRAEVATIFYRLLTDEARAKYTTTDNSFSDIKAGEWYTKAIATLENANIIGGYPDGTFKPNAPITRAEMATIIAKFANLDENGKSFNDIKGHWAQSYVELAAGNGWINGYEDGTFRPDQNISRAETFAMINRVLDRQVESVDDLLPTSQMNMWSDNLDPTQWYYKDVQEATNYHKCDRVNESKYETWTEKVPDIDWAKIQY